MKPQITQMTQMGADPTGMGPPEAASGVAGGQRGRQGRALQKRRDPGAPTEAHASAATSRNRPSANFLHLCESEKSVDPSPLLRHLRLNILMAERARQSGRAK